jgi:hypothetical protein
MMRFYHMTDKECLDIYVHRFFALYKAIRHLELEEEARSIAVTHGSKPADRLKQISTELRKREKPAPSASLATLMVLNQPGVSVEKEPGSIEALRARQKANAERARAEYEAAKNAGSRPGDQTNPMPGV